MVLFQWQLTSNNRSGQIENKRHFSGCIYKTFIDTVCIYTVILLSKFPGWFRLQISLSMLSIFSRWFSMTMPIFRICIVSIFIINLPLPFVAFYWTAILIIIRKPFSKIDCDLWIGRSVNISYWISMTVEFTNLHIYETCTWAGRIENGAIMSKLHMNWICVVKSSANPVYYSRINQINETIKLNAIIWFWMRSLSMVLLILNYAFVGVSCFECSNRFQHSL